MSEIRKPVTHNLKIWPEHYSAVCAGVKRAELRKNDRHYRTGDILDLCEWDKDDGSFTGEFISVTVTHVADVGEWMPGYVLLSIELALRERAEPVYQLWSSGINQWVECDKGRYEAHAHIPAQRRVLYTAPPAPVVPDAIPETEIEDGNDIDYMEPSAIYELGKTHGWNACRAAMLAAPVGSDGVTQDFKLVSRRKCVKCDQTVFGYTVDGLCEECYLHEKSNPVLPECFERLLRHANGMTSGADWNNGTAAKFHRDPLIQAVKDCQIMFKKQPPLPVEVLAGALRNAPLAPSDNQGRQRDLESPEPPAPDGNHWYLVSWCAPPGRFGCTEVRFDNPWVLGSMVGAQKIVADANDLDSRTVVILSVFPIATAPGKEG